jgi:hypothetical protein
MAEQWYAVVREAGDAYAWGTPLREQPLWPEHAAFMDALVEDGLVRLGGPLGEGRALLVCRAASADAVRDRMAEDPWVPTDILRIGTVEPWTVLLGALPT